MINTLPTTLKLCYESVNSFSTSVLCFGKEIPFDHPKIYLEIDPVQGSILCPYCSKKFVLITNDNKIPFR